MISADPPPNSRSTRLQDIAAQTGFAVSTVSRALSNPARVNPRTRTAILAAAKQLEYQPNTQSKTYTSLRSNSIAVLVSDITNPFYFDIIRGTQQQLKAANFMQILVNTEESPESESATILRLRDQAKGAILAASRLEDVQLAALAQRMPLVTINRQAPGIPSVLINTPLGVEQAMDHLVSLGHRSIFYVSGPESSWSNDHRWQQLAKTGKALNVATARSRPYGPDLNSGAAAADALIHSGATACIVFNDLIAIGMMGRLRERGLNVPEDISVVGCDDILGATFCHPSLTTITAPIERAGRMAVSILMTQLASKTGIPAPPTTPQRVVLPTHLTIRKSTGPAHTS